MFDDIDEEWLIAGGMGVLCAFLILIIFKFGGVPVTIGIKVLGMIGAFLTGTVLSKFIFSR